VKASECKWLSTVEGVHRRAEAREGLANKGARAVRQFWKQSAFVDTGFNGGISLPISAAVPLGLVLVGAVRTQLADGSEVEDFVFHGWAQIADMPEVPTEVIVTLSGDPLIGMELLESWGRYGFVQLATTESYRLNTLAIAGGAFDGAMGCQGSCSRQNFGA
jgi:predicted aspartyl protease